MTAEPSCEAVTYMEQIQKFRFWDKLLYACKLDSSIIWIRPPGELKQVQTAFKKRKEWGRDLAECLYNLLP